MNYEMSGQNADVFGEGKVYCLRFASLRLTIDHALTAFDFFISFASVLTIPIFRADEHA